jgi:hypothetical protein
VTFLLCLLFAETTKGPLTPAFEIFARAKLECVRQFQAKVQVLIWEIERRSLWRSLRGGGFVVVQKLESLAASVAKIE